MVWIIIGSCPCIYDMPYIAIKWSFVVRKTTINCNFKCERNLCWFMARVINWDTGYYPFMLSFCHTVVSSSPFHLHNTYFYIFSSTYRLQIANGGRQQQATSAHLLPQIPVKGVAVSWLWLNTFFFFIANIYGYISRNLKLPILRLQLW